MYSLMLERMLPGIVGVAETAVAVDVVQGQALQAQRCDVVPRRHVRCHRKKRSRSRRRSSFWESDSRVAFYV
jgi:hypothetical protein